MKAHVGVIAGVTTGNVHDTKVMVNLTREDVAAVYGDKGYASNEKKCGGSGWYVVGGEREREAGSPPRPPAASACQEPPARQGKPRSSSRAPYQPPKA